MKVEITGFSALKAAKALKNAEQHACTEEELETTMLLSQLFQWLGRATLAESRLPGSEAEEHDNEVISYLGDLRIK